jgi:hypothetical protein
VVRWGIGCYLVMTVRVGEIGYSIFLVLWKIMGLGLFDFKLVRYLGCLNTPLGIWMGIWC